MLDSLEFFQRRKTYLKKYCRATALGILVAQTFGLLVLLVARGDVFFDLGSMAAIFSLGDAAEQPALLRPQTMPQHYLLQRHVVMLPCLQGALRPLAAAQAGRLWASGGPSRSSR